MLYLYILCNLGIFITNEHKGEPGTVFPVNATATYFTAKKRVKEGYHIYSTQLCNEAQSDLQNAVISLSKTELLILSLKDKLNSLCRIDDEIFPLINQNEIEAKVVECECLHF